jgi:hypothetical protein
MSRYTVEIDIEMAQVFEADSPTAAEDMAQLWVNDNTNFSGGYDVRTHITDREEVSNAKV